MAPSNPSNFLRSWSPRRWSNKVYLLGLSFVAGVIGVGAQSTLGGGHEIFARRICVKNQQNARILHDFCPKNIKIPEFLWYLPEKFTKKFPNVTKIDRKIFLPNFRGGCTSHPSAPASYAYGRCRLCRHRGFVYTKRKNQVKKNDIFMSHVGLQ